MFWILLYIYISPISVLLLFNTDKLVNLMQLVFWLVSSAAGSYDLVKSGSALEKAENPRVYFLVLSVGFFCPYNLKLLPETKNCRTGKIEL